jgi:outer membrane biosynthesis protein TonB
MSRRLPFVLLALAVLLSAAASAAAERRVALVIGNSAYKHTPALANPKNDAAAIAGVLRRLGFEVEVQTDLGKSELDAALRRFGDRLEGAQVALFFYAGHGMQVNGLNYIIPIDARLAKERDLSFETVEMGTILKQMEAVKRTNLIFLDACRDNPLARNLARSMGPGRSGSVGRGLAPIDASTGTLISYATRDGSFADDGAGRNSPYTTALIGLIDQPGLEVGLMLRRVREQVMRNTGERQVPWEYGSLLGEFYFAGAPAAAPAAVPAPALAAAPAAAPAPAPPPEEKKDKNIAEIFSSLFGAKKKEEPAPAPAVAAPAPAPAPQPAVDIEAEKKRLADEAERLRREKEQLEQIKALRAEQERVEQERQKVEAAKKLAMSAPPKQRPSADKAAPSRTLELEPYFRLLARDGPTEAQRYFEKLAEVRPDDPDVRAGLAIASLLSRREADAKYQVRRIDETGAQTAYGRVAKGLLLGLEGLHSDSTYQLNRALEQGADRALVYLCMAAAAEKKGEFDQAAKSLEEYRALVPEREQGDFAKSLAQKVDVTGRMVGTFYWTMENKSISAYTVSVTFARSGEGLTGSVSGGTRPGTVSNIQVAGKVLTFRLTYDLGFLFGTMHYDFTADLSRDLNTIPVKFTFSRGGTQRDGFLIRQSGLAQDMGYRKKAGAQQCFIATAAYGDAGEGHVLTLRRFRDRVLLASEFGRRLVDGYYRVSPPLASAIRERPWACALVRGVLAPVVVLAGAALGEPGDLAAVGLVALGLAALCLAARRRCAAVALVLAFACLCASPARAQERQGQEEEQDSCEALYDLYLECHEAGLNAAAKSCAAVGEEVVDSLAGDVRSLEDVGSVTILSTLCVAACEDAVNGLDPLAFEDFKREVCE